MNAVSNKSTDEIFIDWRDAIEVDQEVGAISSISFGESRSLLDGMASLMACRRLALTRTDLGAPWILVGGGSVLWYLSAVQATVDRAPSSSGSGGTVQSRLLPLYAGADSATVMASLTVQSQVFSSGQSQRWNAAPGKLPAGFNAWLAPANRPGEIAPWASLAFALMEPEPPSDESGPVNWVAYAAIFLAVFLVLLAVVS